MQQGHRNIGIIFEILPRSTFKIIIKGITGVVKIGNTVKMAKAKMPLGHLYSCFNFLAYGYAISGYPTHNGDEIAIQKIYRSFIREITKTIWIFYRIMHAASCTIFAWESITPVTTESTVHWVGMYGSTVRASTLCLPNSREFQLGCIFGSSSW